MLVPNVHDPTRRCYQILGFGWSLPSLRNEIPFRNFRSGDETQFRDLALLLLESVENANLLPSRALRHGPHACFSTDYHRFSPFFRDSGQILDRLRRAIHRLLLSAIIPRERRSTREG